MIISIPSSHLQLPPQPITHPLPTSCPFLLFVIDIIPTSVAHLSVSGVQGHSLENGKHGSDHSLKINFLFSNSYQLPKHPVVSCGAVEII